MLRALAVSFGLLLTTSSIRAANITFDFENFTDSTTLTMQYPGLTFSDAVILTAGISLNEFEFPPHSGVNVISDSGGMMEIAFASTVTSFGGYFTYVQPLTIDAYSGTNTLLVAATSVYVNNEAASGDPGSIPNEYLSVTALSGISHITITGSSRGESFVLDDAMYSTNTSVIPEPPSASTIFLFLLITLAARSCRRFHLGREQ